MDLRRPASALGLFVLLSVPRLASAHGDVHDQIVKVTEEISRDPKNPALYLRRGELFRVHEEYGKALADLDTAAKLDPSLAAVELCRGRALLDAGRARDARGALDRYAARRPDDPAAYVWRARASLSLGDRAAAVADFTRALELAPRSPPEIYVERARADRERGLTREALSGVEDGLKVYGPGGVLELEALDLELALGATDAALARLDRLAAAAPRKETLLARRAEILQSAGRGAEARDAWRGAQAALDALAPALRVTPAMVQLQEKIRAGLAGTTEASSPASAGAPAPENATKKGTAS